MRDSNNCAFVGDQAVWWPLLPLEKKTLGGATVTLPLAQ
jgi:hypothetical protein